MAAREQEDLEIAMALSLDALQQQRNKNGYDQAKSYDVTSLYPSTLTSEQQSTSSKAGSTANNTKAVFVKAMYDFQGRETDELVFKAGQILQILDDSHVDWWKGHIENEPLRVGLFPRSYTIPFFHATTSVPSQVATSSILQGSKEATEVEEFCRRMDRVKLTSTAFRFKQDHQLKVNIISIIFLFN